MSLKKQEIPEIFIDGISPAIFSIRIDGEMSIFNIEIEELPEGVYLATSNDIDGLIVECETLEELYKILPSLVLDIIELNNIPVAEKITLVYNLK